MSKATGETIITCGDCGWRGPETTWRRKCRGSPCKLPLDEAAALAAKGTADQ